MLNENNQSGHPCLFPDQLFTIENDFQQSEYTGNLPQHNKYQVFITNRC